MDHFHAACCTRHSRVSVRVKSKSNCRRGPGKVLRKRCTYTHTHGAPEVLFCETCSREGIRGCCKDPPLPAPASYQARPQRDAQLATLRLGAKEHEDPLESDHKVSTGAVGQCRIERQDFSHTSNHLSNNQSSTRSNATFNVNHTNPANEAPRR